MEARRASCNCKQMCLGRFHEDQVRQAAEEMPRYKFLLDFRTSLQQARMPDRPFDVRDRPDTAAAAPGNLLKTRNTKHEIRILKPLQNGGI